MKNLPTYEQYLNEAKKPKYYALSVKNNKFIETPDGSFIAPHKFIELYNNYIEYIFLTYTPKGYGKIYQLMYRPDKKFYFRQRDEEAGREFTGAVYWEDTKIRTVYMNKEFERDMEIHYLFTHTKNATDYVWKNDTLRIYGYDVEDNREKLLKQYKYDKINHEFDDITPTNESSDYIPDEALLKLTSKNGIAFGYLKNKMYVSKMGDSHRSMMEYDYIDDLIDEPTFNKLKKEGAREIFDYPGRIWPSQQIFSLWVYPNEKTFKQIVKDLEKELKIKMDQNTWRIEILPGAKVDDREVWYSGVPQSYLVPISQYKIEGNKVKK